MKLGPLRQITLAAGDDIDQSIAFYRDALRLRFLGRFDPPGIAFFDVDGVRLMLSSEAPAAQLYFISRVVRFLGVDRHGLPGECFATSPLSCAPWYPSARRLS